MHTGDSVTRRFNRIALEGFNKIAGGADSRERHRRQSARSCRTPGFCA
jgi:hypothetical protein